MAEDSSSSSPLTNSHRPLGSGIGMRIEPVNIHNSATFNFPSEAPPPYVEVVDQREVDHK
jgi:hypothetical protein